MSAEQPWYIDSSAIVKLVAREPESPALRRFVRSHGSMVVSALARTEVMRAVLGLDDAFRRLASDVLSRIDLVRVSDQVLDAAGGLMPSSLRSLDAIHLATAGLFGSSLAGVITYDDRMAATALRQGWAVSSPS